MNFRLDWSRRIVRPAWRVVLCLLVSAVGMQSATTLATTSTAEAAAITSASPLTPPALRAPRVLNDAVASLELWEAVTLLRDPEAKMTLDDVRAARSRFEVPQSAYAVLGTRQKVVWLRVPVSVAAQSTQQWVLEFDYALLNRIDVHVIEAVVGSGAHAGKVVQHAVLGNAQPYLARPLAGRSHATRLDLAPGGNYELLLRVETVGTMILAARVSGLADFHVRAVNEQMLQGISCALGLCLLFYSLLKWASLREHLYGTYALLVLASTLFSVHFFGIGEQYLWTDWLWPERHMAGITSLIAAGATALFIEHALGADMSGRLPRAIRIVAAILGAAAFAHAIDLIDIHVVSRIMGSVGLLPALIGLPGAVARVRRGDSVGTYFILAWVGYFIAAATMAGLVNGVIGANTWSMHSFQLGTIFDMFMFMRIAILRSAVIHVAAQRATLERDNLHSLAHTDSLTGLLNRRGLNTTLAAALHNCNPEQVLAVYMLDLDGFKPVNDQFGHDVGDELLVIVGQRLRATMRTGDVVARVGGDEFVVMAGGLQSDQQAQELGAKLLAIFQEPFALGQEHCRVGVTIGYVLAPTDGKEAVSLLKMADAAMYAGKQSGKNILQRGAVSANEIGGAAQSR